MKFNCRLAAVVITVLGIMQLIHQVTSSNTSSDTRSILYYGWFFDGETAKSLETITTSYLAKSLNMSSDFKSFLDSALENSTLQDPFTYFKKPLDPNTQEYDPGYHVTSMFCGACGSSIDDCSSYSDKVANYTGTIFKMEIIGLFFTNKTYGLRLKLNAEQEHLFDNQIEKRIDKSAPVASKQSDVYPGVELVPQDLSLNPSLSSAHVTVGCAPNIPAVQTGHDLYDVVAMEGNTTIKKSNITLGEDLMVLYGDWDAFVIYPRYKMLANATFNPYYCPGKSSLNSPLRILISLTVVYVFTISVW